MWREALPSGNGVVGASVYGGIAEETVMIQHNELWHAGRKSLLPDVSYTLEKTRKLMDQGDYHKASFLLSNELKEQGYEAALAKPLPVADFLLSMGIREGFRQYRRQVNMETGEVTVSWRDGDTRYHRKLFVSRADDVIVYEVESDGWPLEARMRLALHVDGRSPYPTDMMKQSQDVIMDGEYMMYAAQNDADGRDFGVVLRVVLPVGSGEIRSERGQLCVSGVSRFLVVMKVFVNGEREQDWHRLHSELAMVTRSYDEWLDRHVRVHRELFLGASIRLGKDSEADERSNEELLLAAYEGETPLAMIEKMWAYGRYLFISAVRPNGLPFALYGLWGGDYRAQWSHHMANENIQMIYWHAFSGGLSQLGTSFFDYYESLMDDFRENARKLYGCRGIFVPAGTTPSMGLPNQVVPIIMNWTGAAGWLAQHYYRHVQYTGDMDFLCNQALPFMKEVAAFYEDFLVEEEDGTYKIYPSVSPENTPSNFLPEPGRKLDHPMPTTINATMDVAIMKELFTNLIEGSRWAGMYEDETAKWEDILARLPVYTVNEDQAVREWLHLAFDDNYQHRHISHLYPVFPGQEMIHEKEPELFEAFTKAVDRRLVIGLSAQSGWSLAHLANIFARLGQGDRALECLELLSRSCVLNNFFTLHNDYRNMGICLSHRNAPVQLDANMGWVSAVQEMLLFVHPEIVKLLPALPTSWMTGSVRGLRFHTGQVDFTWDSGAGTFEACLLADRDTEITLQLPAYVGHVEFTGGVTEQAELSIRITAHEADLSSHHNGEVQVTPSSYGKGYYTVRMQAGHRLSIRTKVS